MLVYSPSNKKAFTLVELSIVIVIVALIIAGVTTGAGLVKQFKLRSIITNKDSYTSAMRAFELQYGGMAGDITTATSYWAETVNGNGDKKIVGHTEGARAWQQLKLAGLINNGNYSAALLFEVLGYDIPGGNVGVSGYSSTVGVRFFTFGLTQNGWGYATSAVYGKYNTVFAFGSTDVGSRSAFLTPREAASLDRKFDDGKPGTGKLMADNGFDEGVLTCRDGAAIASAVDSSTAPTLTYLSTNAVGCRLMFIYK